MTEDRTAGASSTDGRSGLGDRTERVRPLVAAVLFAGLLVGSAVAVPLVVDARPAREIPVEAVDRPLAEPTAEGWSEVPAADLALASAPSGVPNAGDTSVGTVDVQAARTDDRLYLRLRWQDPTADRNASSPRRFVDTAAVQFPVNASTQPAIAMGSTRNLVNVWYWSPVSTQELLAGGPGTTTVFDQPAVETAATRTTVDGEAGWAVVFARDLSTSVANRTDLTTDADVSVAVAVWNGANAERAGRKAVSEWYYFPFGPEPSGAPFQTLLWAIAGVAIALVIAVTAISVRRARGGDAE